MQAIGKFHFYCFPSYTPLSYTWGHIYPYAYAFTFVQPWGSCLCSTILVLYSTCTQFPSVPGHQLHWFLWSSSAPSYQHGQYRHEAQHLLHTLHNIIHEPSYHLLGNQDTQQHCKINDTKHFSQTPVFSLHQCAPIFLLLLTTYTSNKPDQAKHLVGACFVSWTWHRLHWQDFAISLLT